MADKLSDKVSVIIASPPKDGSFIGSALLGMGNTGSKTQAVVSPPAETETASDSGEGN
jgi:hypothetical protein